MADPKKKNDNVLFIPIDFADIKDPHVCLFVTVDQLNEIVKALNTLWRKRNANTQHMRRTNGTNATSALPERKMSIYVEKHLTTALNLSGKKT